MIDRLAVLQTEADRFAAVLAETPGQARIPTCPDWDAHDLLWHLTEVHLFWAGVLRSGALTEKDVEVLDSALPSRPDSLEETLALRREATAELAAGLAPSPFADGVATGAVDHCADVMWGWMPDWARYTPVAVVELKADGTEQSWLLEVGRWRGTGPESGKTFDQPRAVRAETGIPTAVISGTAQDLALWGWGRGGSIATQGDPKAIAAMQDVIAACIQ